MSQLIAGLLVLSMFVLGSQTQNEVRPTLKSSSDLGQFDLDGSGEWKISDGELVLSKAGTPSGSIRRPAALAILKSQAFSEVEFESDLRSTAEANVQRRDLDLVFAYQAPNRFYYAHISAVTDNVHNGIFVVDNSDRRRVDDGKGLPRLTDQNWHHVKLRWNGSTGQIAVYLDSMPEPILSATDRTITSGRVGVGSFDDTGEFRNIQVKWFAFRTSVMFPRAGNLSNSNCLQKSESRRSSR